MPELFNPNELILEKIRYVEEYDPATDEFLGRFSQVQEPALNFTSEETPVVDAMGSRIATFYNAQSGTFSFNNSLFSLDLAASQFGTEKVIATSESKMIVPVSETIPVEADHTVTLKYKPVGTKGAEVKYVKLVNGINFGTKFEVSSSPGEGKFTLDAENKKITLPEDVTGRVFVSYNRETENAVRVSKDTDSLPKVRKLIIHAIFHDPCNINIVYAGVIIAYRAQIDPTNIEIGLKADGGHAASYVLQKEYCEEDGKLIDIIVAKD